VCLCGCANYFSLFLKSHFFLSFKCNGKNTKTTDGRHQIKFFFKFKQDWHLTSHHKIYKAVETVHIWDKNRSSQGWAGVVWSRKTEWLCTLGHKVLLRTGPPCRIRVRKKVQTCQLQNSGTRERKAEKSQQCPGGVAGAGPKTAGNSVLDLQVKGCLIIFTLKENGCNRKCSEPSRNAPGDLKKKQTT